MHNDTKTFQSQYYKLDQLKNRLLSVEKHLIATDKTFEYATVHIATSETRDLMEYISSTHDSLTVEQMKLANSNWDYINQRYSNIN